MLHAPLTSPGARLREMMASDIVVLPGMLQRDLRHLSTKAGAKGLYITGAGITNANLGIPDIALATLTEFAQQARYVTSVTDVPVISDSDTGFGESLNVMRTVIGMERAGLAGIHIEDQLSPKRCGHLEGKTCVPGRHAAKGPRRRRLEERPVLPNHRPNRRPRRRGLDAAIERAKPTQTPAPMRSFPRGCKAKRIRCLPKSAFRPPAREHDRVGKTPLIPAARFKELGYQMVIFPMTAFRVMLKSIDDCYSELMKTGTQAQLLNQMRTRAELYELIEYAAYDDKDKEWAG